MKKNCFLFFLTIVALFILSSCNQIGSINPAEIDNGNLKITKKDRLKITNYGEKTKSIWLSFHFVYT